MCAADSSVIHEQYSQLPYVLSLFRAEAAASKWWFYIYSLVESFTAKQTESSTQELVKTFQKFMEQSSLGEYEARLNILFAFHCHVYHMQQAVCRGEISKCSECC
jgi:midasin (ATPase involved in ribosome maturation)